MTRLVYDLTHPEDPDDIVGTYANRALAERWIADYVQRHSPETIDPDALITEREPRDDDVVIDS